MDGQSGALQLFSAATSVVARRPKLWLVGVSACCRMARSRWWRRPPFLPLPADEFLHFRMVTMYGGDGSVERDRHVTDIVAWLEWCRTWRAVNS
ncbi:MAG: hypothetical protein VX983_01995 [Actinomycetota bacterium]|nr:hypothetical protein [Acidimicrobiales bacterium]MED5540837.1 hypothetical protein [Actinomycetota bacterium]